MNIITFYTKFKQWLAVVRLAQIFATHKITMMVISVLVSAKGKVHFKIGSQNILKGFFKINLSTYNINDFDTPFTLVSDIADDKAIISKNSDFIVVSHHLFLTEDW